MRAVQRITMLMLALWVCATPAHAAQTSDNDMLETMQGLLVNIQGIAEGIMKDDYNMIANMAEDIAFHPEPSHKRRMAIANELGIEMLTFKMFRDSLRQSALKLKKAALNKNHPEVIEEYMEVLKNCSACHNNYRKQLKILP